MCNDIGEAAYVDSLVAAALLETVRGLPSARATLLRLRERYKLDLAGKGRAWRGVWLACRCRCRCGPASRAHLPTAWLSAPCLTKLRAPLPPVLADYQGEEYVHALGDRLFNCEPERAGQRILKDFRSLALGRICLELPRQYAHLDQV